MKALPRSKGDRIDAAPEYMEFRSKGSERPPSHNTAATASPNIAATAVSPHGISPKEDAVSQHLIWLDSGSSSDDLEVVDSSIPPSSTAMSVEVPKQSFRRRDAKRSSPLSPSQPYPLPAPQEPAHQSHLVPTRPIPPSSLPHSYDSAGTSSLTRRSLAPALGPK